MNSVSMARVNTDLDRLFFWIGTPLLLLGIGGITGGVVLGRSLADTTGKRLTDGIVVQLRGHMSDGRQKAPVFQYAVEGRTYEAVGWSYSYPSFYEVGDRVRVIYSPPARAHGRIYSFVENWIWPIVISAAGVILGLIGAVFVWIGR